MSKTRFTIAAIILSAAISNVSPVSANAQTAETSIPAAFFTSAPRPRSLAAPVSIISALSAVLASLGFVNAF